MRQVIATALVLATAAGSLAGPAREPLVVAGNDPALKTAARPESLTLENTRPAPLAVRLTIPDRPATENPDSRITLSLRGSRALRIVATGTDSAGKSWRFPLQQDRVAAGTWSKWTSLPVSQNPGNWQEPGPALPVSVKEIELEIPGISLPRETGEDNPPSRVVVGELRLAPSLRSLKTLAWEVFDLLDTGSSEWGGTGDRLADYGIEGAPKIPIAALVTDAGSYKIGLRVRKGFQGPVVADRCIEINVPAGADLDGVAPSVSLPQLGEGTYFVEARVWEASGSLKKRMDFLVHQFRSAEPGKDQRSRVGGAPASIALASEAVQPFETPADLTIAVKLPAADASSHLDWQIEDFARNPVDSGQIGEKELREGATTVRLGRFPEKPGAYFLNLQLHQSGKNIDSDRILLGRKAPPSRLSPKEPAPLAQGQTGMAIFVLLRPFEGMSQEVDRERLVRGFREARRCGLSFVDFQVPWRDLEPLPGVFQFDKLDEVVELAAKEGLKVNISPWFSGMHAPRWLLHLPQRDNEGASGLARRGFILDGSAVDFRSALANLWTALATHYASNEAVTGYLLQNPALDWVWREYTPQRTFSGYGEFTVRAYRDFLKQRYGQSLKAISDTYGAPVTSWEEMLPPQPNYTSEVDARPQWRDYYEFRIEETRKSFESLFRHIRAIEPRRRIFQYQYHGGGPQEAYYPLFQQYGIDATCGAVEERHYQQFLTRYDLWKIPSRGEPNPAQRTTPVALNTGFTAILEGGRLAARYSLEWHHSFPEPDDDIFRSRPRTAEIRGQVTQVLANGTPGHLANWSRVMAGLGDATPAPRPVGAFVSQDQGWFVRRSFSSHAINGYDVSKYLNEGEHIVPQWVSDYTPPALLAKCPAIIVDSDNRWLSEAAAASLAEYVRGGGVLLLSAAAGDLHGGAALRQNLGGPVDVSGERPGEALGTAGLVFRSGLSVTLPPGAKVLAFFSDGAPAVGEWELGSGRVILLAGRLDWVRSHGVLNLLGQAPERWHQTASDKIRLVSLQTGTARYVVATYFLDLASLRQAGGDPSVSDKIQIFGLAPGRYVVTEELEGKAIGHFSEQDLKSGIPVTLAPGGSAVFKIQNSPD